MPSLFNRRKTNDALVAQIVEELTKASANNLGATPMSSAAPYAATTAAQPTGGVGMLQTPGYIAVPLPREATAFGSQLGPAAPFLPSPLDPPFDDSGRALPRLYEYEPAWNLNLNARDTPWTVLRGLADSCDIVHRCIEIRISEIVKMDWSFTLSDRAVQSIMAEQNVSHALAMKIGREKYADEIQRLEDFWRNPYPQHGRGWVEWITEFMWQHLTFDGVPVYARYNLGGEVIGFEIIDAPTIKVLLDNRGSVPTPPNPAFQQILWGFPRGEYQASADTDGEFYNAPGRNNEFVRDQLAYFVRNRRTWSPYGFSAVEEALPAASLYLERQRWMRSEFVDGTMPMTFIETDSDALIDHKLLADFERTYNDRIVGSNAERHRLKFLPKGMKPTSMPTIDERYKPEYDEFLIKRIASPFGVSPTQLGIIPRQGIGGKGQQDGEADQAETVSTRPQISFTEDAINSLCYRFLDMDRNIEFVLSDNAGSEDEERKANAYKTLVGTGIKTINEIRSEIGEPLLDMPEADEPMLITATGPVFLKGTLMTDSSGETLGQRSENSLPQEASDGRVLGGQSETKKDSEESQNQASNAEGETSHNQSSSSSRSTETLVTEKEKAAFAKFVKARAKTGKWRDFDFIAVDPETAKALNSQGRALVTGEAADNPKARWTY